MRAKSTCPPELTAISGAAFRVLRLGLIVLCVIGSADAFADYGERITESASTTPDKAATDSCAQNSAIACGATIPLTRSTAATPELKRLTIGTAFAINERSEFLTSYHTVDGCPMPRARISGEWHNAGVLAKDKHSDLAVIGVAPAINAPPLHFRDGRGSRLAETVIVLGFPYAGLLTRDPQATTGVVSALSGIRGDVRYVQLTAPVQPGSSGGPMLDASGNVIGVVSAKLSKNAASDWDGKPEALGAPPENINFAIKSEEAMAFLEANRMSYYKSKSATKLDAADVAESTGTSVVMVGCE